MAATPDSLKLRGPQTLYRHWEQEQWNPWSIDLSEDRRLWAEMGSDDRSLVFWALPR